MTTSRAAAVIALLGLTVPLQTACFAKAPGASETAATKLAETGPADTRPPGAVVGGVPATNGGGPSFFDPFDRLDPSRWYVSDGWVNGDQQGCAWSRDNVSVSHGRLQMRLGRANDRLRPYRCAEIRTHAGLGYGVYEARMRTASGSGLNTAMFTYSGPPMTPVHDEIDFEFLGRASSNVQLNYFVAGKGGHETTPALGFDASAGFNTYAFEWTPGGARWYINGKLVRTASDMPQPSTAGQFFLTLWSGSAAVDGWLGPFDASRTPVDAEVDWVAFTRLGETCRFPESITCQPH